MHSGWKDYAFFALIGVITFLFGISALPAFFRLEGPAYLHAIFLLGMVLTASALWFLSRSTAIALKALAIYTCLFLFWYFGITLFSGLFGFIFFPVLLAAILSISGIRKSENFRVAGLVAVTILVSYLVFIAFLSYSAYQHYSARYIYVKKQELPGHYADLTESFPFLKNVNGSVRIDVPPASILELKKIASSYTKPGDSYFYAKIGNGHFKVMPVTFVGVELADFSNSSVSDEELRCCPTLVKLMEQVLSSGSSRLYEKHMWKVSLEELVKVKALCEEKGNYLEYRGKHFHVFLDCSIWMEKVVVPSCEEITTMNWSGILPLKKRWLLPTRRAVQV